MRVLAVAGASGGHIFPAVSFLQALKKKQENFKAFLVVPRRSAKIQIPSEGFIVKYISISPVNLNFTRSNLIALFNLLKGALESLQIIINFHPDAVVGFGGIESVPLILFAWVFRIRTLIHEQNVLPGKANRLLAKFSDKIAISFIETKKFLEINQERIILTGNPVFTRMRPVTKKEALDFFGFDGNKFTILVIGGSQGSHSINTVFLGAVAVMSGNYQLQVIHITGEADFDLLNKRYKDVSINMNAKIFSFLKEMQYAYGASDIALTRGGATTIAELLFFKLPAVIIPYPYAYNHQLENAKIIEKLGGAVIIEDNELAIARLRKILDEFMNNPDKIRAMRQNFSNYNIESNAGNLLVNAALQ